MPRDSHIPIFLWVAMAILVHLFSGGGLEQATLVSEQRKEIRDFADAVREHVRTRFEPPLEISLLDEEPSAAVEVQDLPTRDTAPDQGDPLNAAERPVPDRAIPKQEDRPEPPKPKPELKKPEEKPEAAKDKLEKKAVPLTAAAVKNRVAVKQQPRNPTEPNPEAEFIAESANKVQEQTQARLTSTDQDSPAPSPGTRAGAPSPTPGDADENELAQSEDKAGAKKPTTQPARVAQSAASSAELQVKLQKQVDARKAVLGHAAQAATPAVEDTLRSSEGSRPMPGEQSAREARLAQKRRQERRAQRATDFLGLGAQGTTESGVNLNLSPSTALAAIGQEQLRQDREHDAERRRSRHRGSFQTMGLQKWRSAIENYVPSVKLGNTTALNTAAVPFAGYLNAIHNSLHPVYAIRFLGSLDRLPADHVMNGKELSTSLEIVLNQENGELVRMGVTKTSGVTAFDVAALEAIQQAQPFGPPPKEIVSPDGRVYLHWEFYRDPFYACSTYFAHPFMLKSLPKTAPPAVDQPLRPPFQEVAPPREKEQHGSLLPGLRSKTRPHTRALVGSALRPLRRSSEL